MADPFSARRWTPCCCTWGTPVMRQALASFARLRFPGGQSEFTPPSRWVVTRGPLPAGADALLLLTVEEMAVNELRETFHHWVRTVALPIKGGVLGDAMAYAGPHGAAQPGVEDPSGTPAARAIWDAVDNEVRTWISNYRTQLTTTISAELKAAGAEATAIEKEAFERRIREVSALQRTASIEKIKREIEEQRTAALQYSLLEDASALAEQKLRGLQDELKRRQSQYGDLQERLVQERDRVVNHVPACALQAAVHGAGLPGHGRDPAPGGSGMNKQHRLVEQPEPRWAADFPGQGLHGLCR
jgi:hypothetical protein